jgi:hypothetical protein
MQTPPPGDLIDAASPRITHRVERQHDGQCKTGRRPDDDLGRQRTSELVA